MNKYLFTTLPSNDLGLLTRSLPIARELRQRGHQIAFCSPAKAPRTLISEADFENWIPSLLLYHLIAGNVGPGSLVRLLRSGHLLRDISILLSLLMHASRASTAEIVDIDHFMSLFGMWHKGIVHANVEALVKLFRTFKPDAIVDFWNPFACIAARVSRIPLVTVIQADMHPQSQGFIWWKPMPSGQYTSPLQATNAVLAGYHLASIQKMGELLLGDLTLVLGIPETDPLPKSANVKYIGPILWQRQDEKLPEWVLDLNGEQPLIWLYPGNIQYFPGSSTAYDSAVVLRACIEALGGEEVQVILTTGHHSLPRQFTPLPPNFRHEPYVPGLAMAAKSDLLIHHGGYGSCQTGLFTGRPALIIPTYSERESNARRVAAQGAGDFVLPKSDGTGKRKWVSADEVRAKAFNILADASFSENAERISKKMNAYGGAAEAARLIEDFV